MKTKPKRWKHCPNCKESQSTIDPETRRCQNCGYKEVRFLSGVAGMTTVEVIPPHSPTPWKLDECFNISAKRDGAYRSVLGYFNSERRTETREENNANAAFIVLAVNAHEELLAAAKRTLKALQETEQPVKHIYTEFGLGALERAIAKAEGKP